MVKNGFIYPLTISILFFISLLILHQVEMIRVGKLITNQQSASIQVESLRQVVVTDVLEWLKHLDTVSDDLTENFSYPHGIAEGTVYIEDKEIIRVHIEFQLSSGREDGFVILYDQGTNELVEWREE
ncbi:competence type IV pilus minor pilin ComGG [Bacillus solimangrovi]|uniref:Competence protein ComG n=1 Tax=Bacillus solimangrovi TaxID=1305675 RepID=A0A1E5LFN0_9BACI|nr:competence type IV pilus minor pilin ComGG [Bacillus solimangrovi]OEH92881.1 hypothetical protein BFG57_14485 [Bacillus solimangrovi]